MTLKVSKRGLVPPFLAMDVMRDAAVLERQGRSIMHLEVGQPSTGIPKGAHARIAKLVAEDTLGYTVAHGIQPLRERIAAHYRETEGARVDPEDVFVTIGSSAAF